VREPRPETRHGQLIVRLSSWMHVHASERGIGIVTADTGFVTSVEPPTVRGPDIAFFAVEGAPTEEMLKGFRQGGPDLAVEVVSPSNTASEIDEKVLEYLGAGTRLVWVVEPRTRSVTAYRSRDDIRLLTEGDVLEGDDVLPGFAVPVARIFALP
jgi:Uma2 family endonuclease